MGCCPRLASVLFSHLNLLLTLFAGAGLVTAARLKWDPTAYIVLRQLLPAVYRTATLSLLCGALLLLLLAHLAAAALLARRAALRRVLLVLYAVVMLCVVCLEASWAGWTAWRVREWLRGPEGQDLVTALELHQHLVPLLAVLGRLHPLPNKLHDLMKEVESDVPRNAYVAGAGAAALLTLQVAGVVLAVTLAHHARPLAAHRRTQSFATITTTASLASSSSRGTERTPLRTAYRNGRIVVL